jgi:hypothetical protein
MSFLEWNMNKWLDCDQGHSKLDVLPNMSLCNFVMNCDTLQDKVQNYICVFINLISTLILLYILTTSMTYSCMM